jgi:2,4-dienoyl-CoA reductase
MAHTLSSLGAKVFITSRREEVLKSASKEIKDSTGNEVAYFPADVRNSEQVEKSLETCISSLGLPDLVINNAAGNWNYFIAPTERLSPNAVKTIVDIVLLGTLNTTLIVGKRLIKEGKGFKRRKFNIIHLFKLVFAILIGASFLSIITTYADTGSGFVLPSATAKAGIVAMTKY